MPKLVTFFQDPGLPLSVVFDNGVSYAAFMNDDFTQCTLISDNDGTEETDPDMRNQVLNEVPRPS